jgi:lipoprotein-anchoring transpeptidase ErfK/SrfK
MTESELERALREAFAARANGAVGDSAAPPPPRFATAAEPARRHRRARLLAPLAAAAAVIGVVSSVAALRDDTSGARHDVGVGSHSTSSVSVSSSRPAVLPASTPASTPASSASAARQVHIQTYNSDGAVYGVGMPVVAYFSGMLTDGHALAAATTVTVNGKPVKGAWYFERSQAVPGYPLEGHLRTQTYWPAHAKIHVALNTKGRSIGEGRSFDNSLTLDFSTGPATVVVVDEKTHRMTVTSDAKTIGTFPVSLGSARTPTTRGTKVIMSKGTDVSMQGPGYSIPHVQFVQRLTYSGEYLHAAPWNVANIKGGIDSSNGCTNLLPTDAKRLYGLLNVGDVVEFPNATGPKMGVTGGFGDWNVPWKVWQLGGALPSR